MLRRVQQRQGLQALPTAAKRTEPQRALSKTPLLLEGIIGKIQERKQAKEKNENATKPKIDQMRVKYNIACVIGTGTAFLGTWLGAHVTEALTGSRMTAATGGSLIVSLIAGNGGFALAWSLIRSRDLKDGKKLAGEIFDKVVKNLASSVPSMLSRIPVSAAAVMLGWTSEWSGVAGFIMAQLVFYSTANALYGIKLRGGKPKE